LGVMRPGLNSVAAAVFGPGESPIGYIALIGLFSNEAAHESGPSVCAAAQELTRQLGGRTD